MSRLTNRRPIITHTNPNSPISEAYRTLRTNIDFSAVDDKVKSVMVTSVGPGEGKSITVSNIAVTYALADKKVLIIDADLRRPTVHHTFAQSNLLGLTNVLTGQIHASEVIKETEIDNLYVMTSGRIPPNPSELLASRRMTSLIEELEQQFDIVIIDTPPVLAVTDAQLIATVCDGVILVIDSGNVKRGLAIKVKGHLEHVKARILGVVLNNIERTKAESYNYYYYGEKK